MQKENNIIMFLLVKINYKILNKNNNRSIFL